MEAHIKYHQRQAVFDITPTFIAMKEEIYMQTVHNILMGQTGLFWF